MKLMSRNPLLDKIGVFIIGIVFIVIGIIIILDNNKAFNEYEKSTDKQTVVAEVKSVYVRIETRRSGRYSTGRRVKKYDCTLEYNINNDIIRNKKTYSTEKKVGDKLTLNVYKDKDGHYQIARFTTKGEKNSKNAFAYALVFIGGCALVFGAVMKSN